MSTPPKRLTAFEIIFSHDSKVVISVSIGNELPPLALISSESCFNLFIFREAKTIFEDLANFFESDSPIPEEAPVII